MISIKKGILIATLSFVAFNAAIAQEALAANTNGGFSYGNSKQGDHWFALSGILQVDHTQVAGSAVSKGTQFRTNSSIRRASIGLTGGVGDKWSYVFSLDRSADRKIAINDAYGLYSGIHDRILVAIGQINPAFSLENSSSSKWLPLLERSMTSNAFGPGQGIGVQALHWGDYYAASFSAASPRTASGASSDLTGGAINTHSDTLVYSGRLSIAPLHAETQIVKFGLSGHYENNKNGFLTFGTTPELSTRGGASVINTTPTSGIRSIQAKNTRTLGLEAAWLFGPVSGEVEYQAVKIKRANGAKDLGFHGYHAQIAYMLTGEHRSFNVKNETLGPPALSADSSAWEIAARHSYITLRDQEINGGSAHNSTLGVNWYLTKSLKVSANYIRSLQDPNPSFGLAKRKLNIFAARFQMVF